MVRHLQNESSIYVVSLAMPSGRLMEQGWPSSRIVATIRSSQFIQTMRHQFSIWNRLHRAIQAHDGRPMESESHLFDGPEAVVLRNQFSNTARKPGLSGLPIQQPAKVNNSGRVLLL